MFSKNSDLLVFLLEPLPLLRPFVRPPLYSALLAAIPPRLSKTPETIVNTGFVLPFLSKDAYIVLLLKVNSSIITENGQAARLSRDAAARHFVNVHLLGCTKTFRVPSDENPNGSRTVVKHITRFNR